MVTDKEDTDPSSPSALRISGFGLTSAKTAGASVEFSSSTKPTTDPGLGPRPPSDPPPPLTKGRPHGVIVPPPSDRPPPNPNAITPPEFAPLGRALGAPPALSKDSVELLLEGMAGARPDRRKTMPQSDGEASAAYHAEHRLRPARPASEPGPKVVVERPSPTTAPSSPGRPVITVPVRAQAAGSREALSTFVPGRVLRRRVAMAFLAGVLIVLLSFMGLRLREGPRAGVGAVPSAASAAVEPAAVAPPVDPAAADEPTASAASKASAPFTASSASIGGAAAVEPSGPVHAAGPVTTRHHHAAGEAPAGDLGEFKSKF